MPTYFRRAVQWCGLGVLWASSLGGVAFAQEAAISPAPVAPAPDLMIREVEYIAPTPQATACPDNQVCSAVSGESVKNFKMNVPAEWDIKFNVGSHAIFMEPKVKITPTPENPLVADPTVSVVVTRNPIPIDEPGLEEYAVEIEKNLNREGDGPANAAEPVAKVFKVFGKTLVDLPNGHKGYLFYVQGVLSGINARQAILVASTQQVQYRVTLTDYEVSFDKTLEALYPIMTSIHLVSTPPERQATWLIWLPWVLALLAVVGAFVVVRIILVRRTKALISEFAYSGASSSADGDISSQKPSSQLPDEDDY